MSNSVPFLPGFTVATQPRPNYNKSHVFDVKAGIRTSNDSSTATRSYRPTNTNPNLSIAQTSDEFDATQTSQLSGSQPRRLPSWVAYARKCLRFYGFFCEAVYSSNKENFRVRKVVIYYYLDDDSIHVAEPKCENSGIPQGVLINRHRIPKENGQMVTFEDLGISKEITLYCRRFRLVDCDNFTREFYGNNGMDLGEPEDYPVDAFTRKNADIPTNHNKQMHHMKLHMEASLGKMMGVNIESTQRFLANDRKVLRFFAMWSDSNIGGEQRAFTIHYFLCDDTVEVLDVMCPNSGREPFPTFLKRAKLPKSHEQVTPNISRIGWTTDDSVQYVTETDLKIGATVNVYGRELFLCGCDTFTKNFYKNNYGMSEADFPFMLLDDPPEPRPEMAPPSHTGFGTEEDSLGSFLYLSPKVPKIDFKKLMQNDGLRLSFLAKMDNASPEDANRRFNVTFHMDREKVGIFERFQRNSGFVGGKFLEKSRLINPATEIFFQPKDFKVGAKLTINNAYVFELLEADMWTKNFILSNPDIFGGGPGGGEVAM